MIYVTSLAMLACKFCFRVEFDIVIWKMVMDAIINDYSNLILAVGKKINAGY